MNRGLLVGIAAALLLAHVSRIDLMAVEGDADGAPTAGVDLYGDPLPEGAVLRLGTLRLRRKQFIQYAAFSPDGMLLASVAGNHDTGVALWDVTTGALVGRLPVARASWNGGAPLAFSPDGAKLVFGDDSGMVQLWDVAAGQELLRVAAHDGQKGGVNSVAFSYDGKQFASGGGDGVVRIWTADEGEASFSVAAQPAPLVGVAFAGGGPPPGVIAPLMFSPDGKLLAAGAAKIHIWNVETGKLTSAIDGGPTKLVSLCFTPDSGQLISGGTRLVPQEKFGKPYHATNVWVPEIRFWNAADGKQVRELVTEEPEPGFGAVALSKDGRTLAAGYEDKLLVWDLPSGKVLRTIAVPKWYGERGLAISSDGRTVSAPVDNSLGLWDVATGEPLFSKFESHTNWICSVAYTPDGERIITGSGDGSVRVWNAATAEHLYERRMGDHPSIAVTAVSPDGSLIAAGGYHDWAHGMSCVRIWRIVSGEPLHFLSTEETEYHNRSVRGLAFSRDGARLVVAREPLGGKAEDIDFWGVKNGQMLTRVASGFNGQVRTMFFAPDDEMLYAVGRDAVVQSWDLANVKQPGEFKAVKRPVEAGDSTQRPWVSDAVFLPDGKHIVTSQNRHLVVWELGTGNALWTIKTPGTDKGRTLGLARDGRLLAMSEVNYAGDLGNDTIRVWDLDTGRELMAFEPGEIRAGSFAFSPDGTRLVSGMEDGTALVWDLTAARK